MAAPAPSRTAPGPGPYRPPPTPPPGSCRAPAALAAGAAGLLTGPGAERLTARASPTRDRCLLRHRRRRWCSTRRGDRARTARAYAAGPPADVSSTAAGW